MDHETTTKQDVVDLFEYCYNTYFKAESDDWALCDECPFSLECRTIEGPGLLCEIMTKRKM